MSKSVRIDSDVAELIEVHARICNRSVPKQLEYMVTVGRLSEENPTLTYSEIKAALIEKLADPELIDVPIWDIKI